MEILKRYTSLEEVAKDFMAISGEQELLNSHVNKEVFFKISLNHYEVVLGVEYPNYICIYEYNARVGESIYLEYDATLNERGKAHEKSTIPSFVRMVKEYYRDHYNHDAKLTEADINQLLLLTTMV